MRRSFSANRTARHLQASVLIGLAIVLLAMLMQRDGSTEEIAAHSAGPGTFPIVTTATMSKADHRALGK
jgi:hypothetical protein